MTRPLGNTVDPVACPVTATFLWGARATRPDSASSRTPFGLDPCAFDSARERQVSFETAATVDTCLDYIRSVSFVDRDIARSKPPMLVALAA
jgi:hypothetical protein